MTFTVATVNASKSIVESADWTDLNFWDKNGITKADNHLLTTYDMSLPRAGNSYIGRALQFSVEPRPVTDSADCTNECLAVDDTFCRYASDPS